LLTFTHSDHFSKTSAATVEPPAQNPPAQRPETNVASQAQSGPARRSGLVHDESVGNNANTSGAGQDPQSGMDSQENANRMTQQKNGDMPASPEKKKRCVLGVKHISC
jgi:hypothetical protein